METLSEANKIKVSLYKKLFKELKQSYIAVPELSLFSAIADMVVVNGDIHIYEIKSKSDSLSRLKNQLDRYKKCAHKVTIVADEKFIPSLIKNPEIENIGIISVNSNMKLRHIKEAPALTMSPYNYLAYWTITELRSSLRGIDGYTKMSSEKVKKMFLSLLNDDEIRKVTIHKIKEQYGFEFLERKRLIEKEQFSQALESRFKGMPPKQVTPLKLLPAYLFRDF
ncbi:MAG: sce7726 family protein [Campylobacterales bacterium]|nr:sce7726 family protein [Campylobacterales bacterium]MBD3823308.1 sce7726 family protein [Campylobacterota bacterium]MBD3841585.1 sce7726 family protein [Campylobacterales bacterium]